ncbi:MAG: DUF72 domain-containing protein [Deltaproteobacteria bacterium]|nr:DUF72 domain-containing protein [Deltaproteobacteria bacterium]
MTEDPERGPAQLALQLAPGAEAGAVLEAVPSPEALAGIAAAVPATVHFGTCGYLFPGWRELVWRHERRRQDLETTGLKEYGGCPLFRAIYLAPGVDAVPIDHDLRRIAAMVPPHVHAVLQMHPEVTTPRFTHADAALASGRSGSVNPHFLDSRFFLQEVMPHYLTAFGDRLGPLLFVFPPQLAKAGITPAAFAERLHRFLAALPPELDYAIELNETPYLTLTHAKLLAAFNVTHVFTTAFGMPPLFTQARLVPKNPELILHLVDPTGRGGARRAELEPFDQIRDRQVDLRREVVRLLALMKDLPAYVVVDNELEGSAPLTILALARMLVAAGSAAGSNG